MLRRAIFGGSFDPPHIGHVLSVKYILSTGAADEVVIVPVFQHVFNKKLTDYDVRLMLTRLAFADEANVQVSSIERDLPTPNYTLNTLLALKEQYPGDQLQLVVGADVLHDVDQWHQFDQVVKLAPLLILGRSGVTHEQAPVAHLPQVSSSQVRSLLSQLPKKLALAPGLYPSQSQDPAAEAQGSTLQHLSTLLPRTVLNRILADELYR